MFVIFSCAPCKVKKHAPFPRIIYNFEHEKCPFSSICKNVIHVYSCDTSKNDILSSNSLLFWLLFFYKFLHFAISLLIVHKAYVIPIIYKL